MSLSGTYGEANDEESLSVLKRALDIGCTFWDSAVVYGMGHNEKLLGRFFKENPGSREKVFLASKCAFDVRQLCNSSFKSLELRSRSISKPKQSRLPPTVPTISGPTYRLVLSELDRLRTYIISIDEIPTPPCPNRLGPLAS